MLNNVDEIKSKLDIVDIIQEFFPLKQAGANFKANCPFHNEKTPSFMVSREKQIFHCFGCNEGGDMFTFIQKMEGIEFPEALRILAKKAGVQLQYQDPGMTNLKTCLQDINREAADWFVAKLREDIGRMTLNYLLDTRRVSENTIREFKIGYAPDAWDALSRYLKSRGFADHEIKQSGLVVEKQNGEYYDRFRNRLMIPMADHHGVLVGFSGRAMSEADEVARYVNTPQTLIYNKSVLLYGVDKAKQEIRNKGQVILVEGHMDVIACHQVGTRNVVGISGTALTQDHLKILKRYSQNLVFCLDTDSAGQVATSRGFDLAWASGVNIKIMNLPLGFKDPDELIQSDPKLWQDAIGGAKRAMDYFFDRTFENLDISSVDNKKKAASYLLGLIGKLNNPIEQDHYLKDLAKRLGVEEEFLREALKKAKVKRVERVGEDGKGKVQQIDKIKVLSERILALMLADDTYVAKIVNELPVEALDNNYQELYKEIIIYYTNKDKINNNIDGERDLVTLIRKYLQQQKPRLAGLFDVIEILSKDEWVDKDEAVIRGEMISVIKLLKRDYFEKRLRLLQTEITRLENSEQKEKLQELMQEFSRLTSELKGVY